MTAKKALEERMTQQKADKAHAVEVEEARQVKADADAVGDKEVAKSAAERLAELAGALTPEQKEELEQIGFVVPTGDIQAAIRGEYSLGYRCKHCNSIGLYFVGNSWPDGVTLTMRDGSVREAPPLHLPIDKIAWTQKGIPAGKIDRHKPRCQVCTTAIVLQPMRRLNPKYIVPIQWFESTRDKSFSRTELEKVRKDSAGADAIGGFDSNYGDKRGDNVSNYMTEQDKSEVSHLAQVHDPLSVTRKGN